MIGLARLPTRFFPVQPFRGIGLGPCVSVHGAKTAAQGLDVAAELVADQILESRGLGRFTLKQRVHHVPHHGFPQRSPLHFIDHRQLRIQAECGAVFAQETQAEGMQGADLREFEPHRLLIQPGVSGSRRDPPGQLLPQPGAHLPGRRLGEGHHQETIRADPSFGSNQPFGDPRDQGRGLAGAGAGHDQNVALGGDRFRLLGSEDAHAKLGRRDHRRSMHFTRWLSIRGFHAAQPFPRVEAVLMTIAPNRLHCVTPDRSKLHDFEGAGSIGPFRRLVHVAEDILFAHAAGTRAVTSQGFQPDKTLRAIVPFHRQFLSDRL